MKGHNYNHNKDDICKKCGRVHIYPNGAKGKKWSEKSKVKKSLMMTGEGNIFYGKHHSEETKRKISIKHLGKISWLKGHNFGVVCKKCGKVHISPRLGKKDSEETKRNLSLAHKGQKGWFEGHMYDKGKGIPCEKCGKIHLSGRKGKHNSEELRKKLSQMDRSYMRGINSPMKRLEVREKLRVANIGKTMSLEARHKMSLANYEHWSNEEFRKKFLYSLRTLESPRHAEMKASIKKIYEEQDYNVFLERPVMANGNFYVVDIYAIKEGDKLAFECGNCSGEKLRDLTYVFDRVIHMPYEGNCIIYNRNDLLI